ncbi:Mitochondrial carrier triple repeat protein 1 [Papilio xuthus]|uniref:Mitochondrial carrier triple repeat protein 1 n=1 Tax=Papilio xuthus TaxID=66420 RepID=A0A194PJK9_PAPXU|nr:Mitochondrial carrier triple repeat protein 1 [Papilio xuthus]
MPASEKKASTHWKEFACGGGSAFCNILISYPLNKLIFRQMMHGVEATLALNQLQKEGLTYLYRGMLPPLLQRSFSMSLMFGVYDECLQPLLHHKVNPYVAKSIAGMVAGCFEATLMPFERLQTLLIHPKFHKEFKNTAHAGRHIAKYYVSQRPKYREDYRFEKAFNSFYKLHSAANWSNARIRCEAEGSHLMVPDTLDEADAMPLLIASALTTFEGVYVGIHDFYTERYFVTIKGSKLRDSILDLLWESEQPVYGGGRCVAMRRNGRFYVNPCTNRLPFICKTKAKRVSYYEECDTFDSRWKLGNNGSCYITHAEPQTWHEAHGTCLSAGGYLAILDTRDEAEYIREQFKEVDQVKTPGDFAFLGFSDLFQAYHYRTVHGKPLSRFLDWDLKCPQSDDAESNGDRCGGIRRSGLLATADCTVPAIFFCEKPAKGTYQFKSLRHNDLHKHHKHIKQEIKVEEKSYLLYVLFFYVWFRGYRILSSLVAK